LETGKFGGSGSAEQLLERLAAQHRELKARVHELESHISLTTSEQVELARLKKLKLHTKDQLYSLRNG